MNVVKKRRKRIMVKDTFQRREGINTFIQPFKELPSVNRTNQEDSGRINAHELFSLYTADIIKEDSIFIR